MSLHKFAEQVAANGRGEDSLLVHMTPDEVQRLQKFAQANGTSLTINPTTGLPEAGMLSDLFKAVAPIALGAFLGPAGMGLTFGGLSSAMSAGIATGGITALATGSLSRGLMAGLGAYGGAGLGEGLMGAATSTDAFQAAQSNLGPEANAMSVKDVAATANINPYTTGVQALGTEQGRAAALNAMGGTKGALTAAGMAAAPLMAMQPTTKMPEPKGAGYIRQMDFNINPDTGRPDPLYGVREMSPVKANEWGDKTFQGQRDLFRQQNPNPYELGTASLNQPPKPMAGGGIVALAGGGVSDQQVVDWFKANPGANDQAIAAAMQQYNVDPTQVARATGTQNQLADYENRYQTATNQNILAAADKFGPLSTATAGGTGTAGIADWMDASGISAKEYANALTSRFGAANPYTEQGIQSLYNTANKVGDQAAIINAASPVSGIHDPANDKAWAAWMDANKVSVSDAARAFGLSDAETQRRYDAAKKPNLSVIPSGYYGNNTGNPLTTTPGDITTNPDNTVTVQPNIPGRPTGGFTGMGQVKDVYTAGGGSLGYTPKAPRTVAEFNQLYNKQTGDSLAAYNYLMGKGANNNAYPVKSSVPKISMPYDEYVLGKKTTPLKRTTQTTTATGDSLIAAKTINVLDANGNTEPASLRDDGKYYTSSGDAYDVTGKQVAAGGGMMGYADGGITGSGGLDLHIPLDFGGAAGFGGGGGGISLLGGGTSPTGGTVNPNAGMGGYAEDYRSGKVGGLYKGPMTMPAGLDDMMTPDIMAANAATQAKNAAAQANARANPVSLSSLAKTLGGGMFANGGMTGYAVGGGLGSLGGYSDGGRLLKGPGDGVSDSIPATIGTKQQPARLADGEFVVPARIVSELGNGSTDAGAKKLYAMMDRVQRARGKTTGKNKVAANSRADKYLPA